MIDKPYILCVDDDKLSIEIVFSQLKSYFGTNYNYESAATPAEAIEILQELTSEGQTIIAVISDWNMPGKFGDEFLMEIKQWLPETRLILMTGYEKPEIALQLEKIGQLHKVLIKPCDKRQLVDSIAV